MFDNLSTRKISIELDNGYKVSQNLHIKVTVTKSRLALPNSAKIEIFNISEESFKKFVSMPRVLIYVDDKQIFTGKIINAQNEYKITSWLCTLYCNDIKTNPYANAQYLIIPKGTSNEDMLQIMASAIADAKIDASAFAQCQKAKGSLLKQMVVEYKKEGDVLKAIENTFKGCNTKVFKDDGVVKLQDSKGVPNHANPIIFDRLIESPRLSHQDIVLKIPLDYRAKLGLGFKIKAKTIIKNFISPYTYQNQFHEKTYSISEVVHEVDNFTKEVAITTIKGLNFV